MTLAPPFRANRAATGLCCRTIGPSCGAGRNPNAKALLRVSRQFDSLAVSRRASALISAGIRLQLDGRGLR